MNKEIFNSERYFTVFDYLVSHGQLLLRSDKIKGYDKNIDIIFFDARFIQLFSMLNGLNIRIAEKKEFGYDAVNKYFNHDTKNLFEIESGGETYYVGASFVKIYENDLEFSETSLGFDMKGREKEIGGSR